MPSFTNLVVAFAALFAFEATAIAAVCTAASTERRVALLELYTSEGCDSCPPADRWVSSLAKRGFGLDRVVVLGYHVDYWDYIGWRDPYAQPRFSERQRSVNSRIGVRTIYTPQLMLNGRDYRRAMLKDDFAERLAQEIQSPAKASIRLTLDAQTENWKIDGAWAAVGAADARNLQAWLALYENRLAGDVRAGENRGKRLEHDFVVRDLVGPFAAGGFRHVFKVNQGWKRADLGVAAFVQDFRTGETLQATALPVCRS
jgi:hypothetical protein